MSYVFVCECGKNSKNLGANYRRLNENQIFECFKCFETREEGQESPQKIEEFCGGYILTIKQSDF